MALTPQMIAWNKRMEEDMKKKREISVEDLPESIIELYSELKKQLLDLGENIKIVQRKNYISFKAKTNFVDIEPHPKCLKCQLNVKKGHLKDMKKISRDVSNIGHFGAGDYEVIIKSVDEIQDFIILVKQSYKFNS